MAYNPVVNMTQRQISMALALSALALIAAGCGAGSPSSTQTSSGQATGSAVSRARSEGVAYASCMRSHGVPNFPDPQVSEAPGGGVRVKQAAPVGALEDNPRVRSALQACRSLLPGGGPGGEGQTISPSEQEQYLRLAACIRAHGVPNLHDPTFSSNGVHVPGLQPSELSSPTFEKAEQACRSLIPKRARGGGEGHAGG
jgi:hypothetical protein